MTAHKDTPINVVYRKFPEGDTIALFLDDMDGFSVE